jgi:hypothetical protein
MRFEGIYTPVITPYHEDHSIDREGFATMIESLISAGVNGIVVAGTTGEYYAQTPQERIELMELAGSVIGGRVALIIGVGALRTEDGIGFAEQAARAGADCLLIGAPYYAVPTGRELARHVLAITEAADLPVMLYNYPGRTGVMMGAEFLDQVGSNPHICAIKESSGDINQLHRLARDYPHIQLSCGMDDQALEFFAWGARSWVPTSCRKSISRCIGPAPSMPISPADAASWRRCCRCCTRWNRAVNSSSASNTAAGLPVCRPVACADRWTSSMPANAMHWMASSVRCAPISPGSSPVERLSQHWRNPNE